MLKTLSIMLFAVTLISLVACGSQEDPTPTPAPSTPKPAATQPEPTAIPTEIPPTDTPEPTATSEPEAVEPEITVSPAGYWEGKIATSGIELAINVEFSEGAGGLAGTIDIPQQGAAGLALENITLAGDQLHFEIAGVGAMFDGTVTETGIAGDFGQGAATGTFELAAAERVEESTEPAVDLPYSVEEVMWEIDGTVVNATLTRPEGEGPFPAVLMVAGSGPTDRDWNSPLLPGSNGSAALLADVLTRAGYVTLRYDKRVTGPEAMANLEKLMGKLSMDSHLKEVAGGMVFLAEDAAVDSQRIFALANSEGTLHALNYQLQNPDTPFAGLILAAPPGRTMGELMRSQLEPQLAAFPDPEGLLALYDEAIERFLAGEPMEPSPDLPEGIQQLLLSLEAPANLPFARELFEVNPAAWLAEIEAPVLVLIGKKDIQVDWQVDGARLEETAAGMENVIFAYPDNANHVLKYEEKAAEELTAVDAVNYNAADRVLDELSVATILAWLLAQ
jgi:pimeloyl-ACP methyl ester carboxylesterase